MRWRSTLISPGATASGREAAGPKSVAVLPTCFAPAVDGHRPGMTDRIEREQEIDLDVELEEDADNEQVDRAPQPGNTPAPDDPPLDSGATTGKLADDP